MNDRYDWESLIEPAPGKQGLPHGWCDEVLAAAFTGIRRELLEYIDRGNICIRASDLACGVTCHLLQALAERVVDDASRQKLIADAKRGFIQAEILYVDGDGLIQVEPT